MTAQRVQWLRDTWANLVGLTLPAGMVVVDDTNWRWVIHDGATAGGFPVAMAKPYTVAALPAAGVAGRTAFATNGRAFNGTGTLEGAGTGTGVFVSDNGTAWKIIGTNVTVSA